MTYRQRTISELSRLVPEIVYVMCGARGETSHPLRALPQLKFIGFEPDLEQYNRPVARSSLRSMYFNTAVGGRAERRRSVPDAQRRLFTLAAAQPCLVRPVQRLRFRFGSHRSKRVDTVCLDAFLPQSGIPTMDFLHLDTQGTELEILQGARKSLLNSVVAIKCERSLQRSMKGKRCSAMSTLA